MYHRVVQLILPKTESLDIEFENLGYTVSTSFRNSKKHILKGINGCFKSGELTAIMGPSGAGKSSLLNILTGFQKNGVTGNLQVNSKQGNSSWSAYTKETCYIQQDDLLSPLFSVQEIMNLACDLKLGSNLSSKAKELLIDDILDTLDLSKTKMTRCDRLSGGQKKRLSIALELVDNPPVMFLDEPTTGLDSSSSLQCISMLHSLAKGGRAIICTIHQPSATIYEMFDHVYLLAGGSCVYQGDPKNTVSFLKSVGLHCPKYHNPADYIVEVICEEYGSFNDRLITATAKQSWRSTKDKDNLFKSSNTIEMMEEVKSSVIIKRPSEFSRFWTLMNRSRVQLFRDWTVTHLKLGLHVLVGILLGLTYGNSGGDGSKSLNNACLMLVNSIYVCYTSLMPAVLKFPMELPIIKKEHFNNWYKLRTYYAAVMVTSIPLQMVYVIVYSSTVYFLTNQPPDMDRYLKFLLSLIMVGLIAESLGLFLGTVCDPVNGTFLGAIVTCAYLVFAGVLVLFKDMPRFMYYITYVSYLRYAVEGILKTIYGNNRSPLDCPFEEELTYCHFRIPKTLLSEFDMLNVNYWFNICILAVYLVLLRTVAFCTLKRKIARN